MNNICRGAVVVFILLAASSGFAQNCTSVTDGDLFVDKDWHVTNDVNAAPDGRYPADGGIAPFERIQDMIDVIEPGQCGYVRKSATPYKELGKKSGEAAAGNTFLRGGSSENERIIVSGYPGERPIIDNAMEYAEEGQGAVGFLVAVGDYITIRNFEIRYTTGPGVMMHHSNTNRYITVENCHIHHNYGTDNVGGVRLDWCDNCLVRNNVIHDTYKIEAGSNPINNEPHIMHSGIHGFRPSNSVIENNLIYNVRKGVYQKEPHPEGLKSNEVRYNIFYNVYEAAYVLTNMGAGMTPSYDASFHHNLVYNSTGAVSASFYEADGIASRLKVYNNTIIDAEYVLGISNVTDVEFYNNLIYGSGGNGPIVVNKPGDSPRTNSFKEINYNLYFDTPAIALFDRDMSSEIKLGSLDALQGSTSLLGLSTNLPQKVGENSLYVDPKFVSFTNKNFTLSSESKAVGAGKGGATIGAYGNGVSIGPDSTMILDKIDKMPPPCIRNQNNECM